jgi:AcrR family transcriptional regulator
MPLRDKRAAGAAHPRRRLSAPERRERIEAAATQLIGERGYAEASIDAICGAAGITPPVLYEHFPSKQALYAAVLQSHFARLRSIWEGRLGGGGLSAGSVAGAIDAWFAHVEANPEAARLLFREPSAVDAATIHRTASAQSRDLVLRLLVGMRGAEPLGANEEDLEMTWVVLRGVLQGLALWWVEHPEISRKRVVASAFDSLWRGYQDVLGERSLG